MRTPGGELTLDDGHDCALLDGRRALETIGVDAAEKLWLEVHRIEGVDGLIVVALDLSCGNGVSEGVEIVQQGSRAPPKGAATRCSCHRQEFCSPSGTSSRPLSAMIAVGRGDHRRLL
jgi:hypothetical protein